MQYDKNNDLLKLPRHGTLIQYEGVGVLLTGDSGVGKSETALSMIDQGGKLVCDDAPVFSYQHTKVVGKCDKHFAGLLHIRQLGILNIAECYPEQEAFLLESELHLIIHLQPVLSLSDSEVPVIYDRPLYEEIIVADDVIYKLTLLLYERNNIALLVKTAIKQFKANCEERCN
ncbi:MAG: HPr kinase/phosphatase C-terminal domain-containing protein [Gammaproteobacteria bacterium]|nr:HPr kinase/phosphatase C-terminal domain-containing protein [Gammaproteobacteria bacterium]